VVSRLVEKGPLIASGAILPVLALLAGVLSFSSPCALPLVPGYLGFMSGVSAGRGRTMLAATLFVLGFAFVFTFLGWAAVSATAGLASGARDLLDRVAGVLIILLGLFVAGLVRLPFLMREGRPLLERVRPGPAGALFLGVAFAVGWTPCIGPVLGSILLLAGGRGTGVQGASLLLIYSLGLGIPFLLAAAFVDRFQGAAAWLRRRATLVNAAAGLLLAAMGVLVFTGDLNRVLAPALDLYARLQWPPL
jgi:cytochrome c-type biogenesis protein